MMSKWAEMDSHCDIGEILVPESEWGIKQTKKVSKYTKGLQDNNFETNINVH